MSGRGTRSNPGTPDGKKSTLSEIKAAARRNNRGSAPSKMEAPVLVLDPFMSAMQSKDRVKGKTGFIFDEKMAEHKSPWDPNHIECPERILKAKSRCDELGLISKCEIIQTRKASEDEMLLCHSKEYLEILKSKPLIFS